MDEAGQGSGETLARLLWRRADAAPDAVAYRHVVRTRGREATEELTWAGTRALVEPLAAGLVDLGVEPGDRVALLSRTRVDAVLGHLAVLCAGAATTALHPGAPPGEVARVVHGSGSVVVLAEDRAQVDKLRVVRGDIRGVRKVVQLDGDYPDHRVMTLEALLARGEGLLARDPATVVRRVAALAADALATVLHPVPPAPGTAADGIRRTHREWVAAGADAGADAGRTDGTGLRPLRESLALAGAHALVAAQLTHGFGVEVDAGRDPHG